MTDRLLDPELESVIEPGPIAGVYNYCNRWCERCRFTTRCGVFRSCAEQDAAGADDVPTLTASTEQVLQTIQAGAERFGIDLSTTDEESEAIMQEEDRITEAAKAEPVVLQAREYSQLAWPVVRALRPVLEARADAVALDALRVIEALMLPVASKTYRAVRSEMDPWTDRTDPARDSLGSAKIARIMIADSRHAWRVLMEVGRAAADGVPAKLDALLEDVGAGLARRFPTAMQFVRPGFDTEDRHA
jgi:hypothetical protein